MIVRQGEKAAIELFNTLGRKKEIFEPIKAGHVSVYTCGPTVYDYVTIGNLRSYVFADTLRRTLEYAGYKVKQVMNITDFGHLTSDADEGEDKMTVGLKREGMAPTMENMHTLATRYIDAFRENLEAMNIEPPTTMPRASEHVRPMIAYVHALLEKGYAYTTSDGIYFDVGKFPSYGILGGAASLDHSRIGINPEKHDPRDFTLWKFNEKLGWDAPWGHGFPGWHIECTAMSTEYLGKSFDIHTGGIDHIAVHHNNEIAQAEAANNRTYVRYWLHHEFITIDAQRIGKSVGNAITLAQLQDRGVSPLAYRYWLLTGHYRSPMNFTWEAVEAAQTARDRALKIFANLTGAGPIDAGYKKKFNTAIYDDLGTPAAIAVMWELLKDEKIAPGVKRATLLMFDTVLGIGFNIASAKREEAIAFPDDIHALVDEREAARATKDFAKSDALRAEIEGRGYSLEDTEKGPILKQYE